MKEISIEVTVGAFMFMILLALSIFTIILSRDNIFTRTYLLEARFNNAMGLRAGDSVHLHGVEVGKVSRLKVVDNEVHVVASLSYPVKLYADYRVEIVEASVLGGRLLLIDVGSPDEPIVPHGTVLKGLPPKDIIAETTDLVDMIRNSLDEGAVLRNLAESLDYIRILAQQAVEAEGTLNLLLTTDGLYRNLEQASEDIMMVTGRLNRGEGTVGRLLTDDTVYEDLVAATGSIREITTGIQEGKGLVGRLISDEDAMVDDFAAILASLREITEAINAGEGTIGALLRNDELYAELLQLITETRAAIDDFRETSPITTFTGIFFGAF